MKVFLKKNFFTQNFTLNTISTCCLGELESIAGSVNEPISSYTDVITSNNSSLVTFPSRLTSYKLKIHLSFSSSVPRDRTDRPMRKSYKILF